MSRQIVRAILSHYADMLRKRHMCGVFPVPACLLSATLHATASVLVSIHSTQAVNGIASFTHRNTSNSDACTGFEAQVHMSLGLYRSGC